jgi:ribonuclease P protein component
LNNKLTKEERVHGIKLVNKLFTEGRSIFIFPFKIFFLIENDPSEVPLRFFVTVTKKSFKKAVERNHIKRLVRESYRLNKNELCLHFKKHNKNLIFGLVYVAETILSYQEIERKLILILQRLIEQDEELIR